MCKIKSRLFIFLSLFMLAASVAGQTEIKVNPSIRYQKMKGWGVTLCWWANMAGGFTDDKVDEICNWITSPEELNMNVFRYNIGGGDNPLHDHLRKDGGKMPGFKASASATYDWSQDAGQRKILLKLNSLRTDVINEAFSNSPPYWMTKSNCVSGNTDGTDNLKDDFYDDFADYLTEVVKYYKENHKITFHTLSPFNEPFSNWWKANGGQEGCMFNQRNQQKLILEVYSSMEKKELLESCSISAMDANSIDETVNGINGYAAAGNVMDKIEQINSHSYFGSKRAELFALGKKYKKEVWQSETGPLSINSTGLDNHLEVAKRLIKDLREMKPVVWCDWQMMSDQDPRWGLIPANYSNRTYYRAKSYYVRMQCSRFIKQGYTIIESNNENTVAAINPEGTEVVFVICNSGTSAGNFTLDLSNFNTADRGLMYRTSANEDCKKSESPEISNSKLAYNAPAKSITTFIIPVSLKLPLTGDFQIIARHSNKALQVNDNSSVAQSTNVSSQNQWWNILPVEDFYKITNKETGLALEVNQSEYDNGASIISSSFSSEDNQLWSIVDLGNGYYELLNKYSLKAVDIASASMNEGATAIQYTFEGSENQQFLLSSILTNTTENNSLTNTFFPNPFEKNILVRTTLPLQYVIVDVLGNTIESGNCQENCMVGEMLQTGVYTLILKEEGMIYRSIKLVKK